MNYLIKNRRVLLWTVFILYYLLTVSQHMTVTHIVINPLETPFGTVRISDHMSVLGIAGSIVMLLFILYRCIRGHKRFITSLYWGLWVLCVYVHHETLLFSANSYVHYPQYIIFSLLLSYCLDKDGDKMPVTRLMFWSVMAGSIDELAQYLYICADVAGHYLDFNDILLNAQGAAAGLLLRYGYKAETGINRFSFPGFKTGIKRFFRSVEGRVAITSTGLIFMLILTGFLRITPPEPLPKGTLPVIAEEKTLFLERQPERMGRWNTGPVGRYYVLTVFEGILFNSIYFLLFCSFALFYPRRTASHPAPQAV